MAVPKAASIAIGVMAVGVGAWQVVRGFQQCNGPHDFKWSANRAPAVDIGDFKVKVPDGWRDAAESGDDKMKALLAQQPGAKVFVRETFDGQIAMMKTAANDIPAGTPCPDLANMAAKNEGATATDVSAQTFDGDPGCRWTEGKGDVQMQYNLRFHGGNLLSVMCSGPNGGICAQVLTGITAKK